MHKVNLSKSFPFIKRITDGMIKLDSSDHGGVGAFAARNIKMGWALECVGLAYSAGYSRVLNRNRYGTKRRRNQMFYVMEGEFGCINAKNKGSKARYVNHSQFAFNMDIVAHPCKKEKFAIYIFIDPFLRIF
jgi:hypothetical protein